MKAVITRVTSAHVEVEGKIVAQFSSPDTGGLLALVGVGVDDEAQDAETMARKIAELRILEGELSASDCGAPIIVVSQFTLQGATKKGRRPSWSAAAPGPIAEPLFEAVVQHLRDRGLNVGTGVFGAMMDVHSVNSGPFTVLVDTRS